MIFKNLMKLKLQLLLSLSIFSGSWVLPAEEVLVEKSAVVENSEKQVQSRFDSIKSGMKDLQAKMKSYVLPNGVKVVFLHEKTVELACVATVWGVGSANETSKTRGYAHLLEHMFYKGTDSMMSEVDIHTICKERGYSFGRDYNAYTQKDTTMFYFNIKPNECDLFLSILADCAKNVRCGADQLSSELEVVINEMFSVQDNPVNSIFEAIIQSSLPKNHPYIDPTIGYIEQLAEVTSEKLLKFKNKHYRPDNCMIVVCGNFDQEKVERSIEKLFGDFQSKAVKSDLVFPPLDQASPKTTKINVSVSAPEVILSWVLPADNMENLVNMRSGLAAELISCRLDCGLYKLLVKDLNLAHSVSVFTLPIGSKASVFCIEIVADEHNLPKCFDSAKAYLKKLAVEGFPGQMLDNVMSQRLSAFEQFIKKMPSNAFLSSVCQWVVPGGFSPEQIYSLEFAEKELSVSTDDIRLFVAQYLNPDLASELTILPMDQKFIDLKIAANKKSREYADQILKNNVRTSDLEAPKFALQYKELFFVEDSKQVVESNTAASAEEKPVLLADAGFKTSEHKLENGLNLVVIDRPSEEYETCALGFYNSNWINNSLEGQMLFSIAKTLVIFNDKKQEIDKMLIDIGAGVSLSNNGFFIRAPKGKLLKAIEILVDLMLNPRYESDLVQRSIGNIQRYYLGLDQNPAHLLFCARSRMLYEGTDFAQTPLDCYNYSLKVGVEDVNRVRKELFCAENMVVAVGSTLTEDQISELKGMLSKFEPKDDTFVVKTVPAAQDISGKNEGCKTSARQATLQMFRISPMGLNDKRIFGVWFINGFYISPAMLKIREASGLFYSADLALGLELSKQQRLDTFTTTVSPENVEFVKMALSKVFADLTCADLSEQEFLANKATFINSIKDLVKGDSYPMYLANSFVMGLKSDFYKEGLDYLEGLSFGEFKQLLMLVCNDNGWATITVGGC